MRVHHKLFIAVGGVAGATVRWLTLQAWPVTAGSFPAPIFVINVVGSLVLGAVLGEETRITRGRVILRDALAIGFCGGLTTFSTLAVEVAQLGRGGDGVTAAAYVVVSVLAAVGAFAVGELVARDRGAVVLPVEGRGGDA